MAIKLEQSCGDLKVINGGGERRGGGNIVSNVDLTIMIMEPEPITAGG